MGPISSRRLWALSWAPPCSRSVFTRRKTSHAATAQTRLTPIMSGTKPSSVKSWAPFSSCSINPTRSFGPAVVASIAYSGNDAKTHNFWKYHYIFWLGPIIGSLLGVGVYKLMEKIPDKEASETGPTDAKGCV